MSQIIEGPSDQGQQQSGGVSSGINTINNLVNFRNSHSGDSMRIVVKVGKVALQVARRAFTSPWFIAIITTTFISVVTFIISLFSGFSGE